MKLIKKYSLIIAVAIVLFLQSCQQPGGNNPGSEFMPDMAHSVAYEANYYNYYYNNTWGSEAEYYEFAKPRQPVNGTVPRSSSSKIAIPQVNANSPYYYGDSDAERERAIAEIIDNPHPITDAGLAQGKELYGIFCATCHGDKGDGNGYLIREDGGMYPAQPANLISDDFINASNGRYYHSIMFGKNLMGAYKDKLNVEERWQVIHYIRSLQAKEKKLVYNQYTNTLNSVDRPAGDRVIFAEAKDDHHNDEHGDHGDADHSGHKDHDDDEGHGHDHDGHDHDHHEGEHHDDEHQEGQHDHDHENNNGHN